MKWTPFLDADPIFEKIVRYLRKIHRQVGFHFIGSCQVLERVQGVIRIQHHVVGIDVGCLDRIDAGWRLVHRVAIDLQIRIVAVAFLFLGATRHDDGRDHGQRPGQLSHV